jgi:hypothetical protein
VYVRYKGDVGWRLLEDTADIALSTDHPLAYRDCVDLDEVVGEPWIGWSKGSICGDWLDNMLRARGVEPVIVHYAEEHQTRLALAAAGLVALASALVLPTLLVSDWLVRRPKPLDRAVFRALGGLQLLLLVLVIVSAFQRVRSYQEAYGLTESRFYGVAFLGWLTMLSVWFGATVLRGRRERFAFPALLSGFAVVAALFVANPDVWIARTNLQRSGISVEATAPATAPESAMEPELENAQAAARSRPSVDVAYLASLSADAVPTLLHALPRLQPDARCLLAQRLLERWGTDRDLDWRSWNRAVAHAREAVRNQAVELRRMIAADAGCPSDGT